MILLLLVVFLALGYKEEAVFYMLLAYRVLPQIYVISHGMAGKAKLRLVVYRNLHGVFHMIPCHTNKGLS